MIELHCLEEVFIPSQNCMVSGKPIKDIQKQQFKNSYP